MPEVPAAEQMTEYNDTNSIMRGNMSVQSDPNRRLAARHAASMAMRSSFSDAGEDRVDRDTNGVVHFVSLLLRGQCNRPATIFTLALAAGTCLFAHSNLGKAQLTFCGFLQRCQLIN